MRKEEIFIAGGRRLAVDMRLRQYMEVLLTEKDAKNGGEARDSLEVICGRERNGGDTMDIYERLG